MTISRDDAINRAKTGWPMGGVPYSQSSSFKGYRADCSGFVSMCLNLGTSFSTVTLPMVCHPISWNDIKPADICGKLGPGTGGNDGHVQFIVGVSGNSYTCIEQTGGSSGPHQNTYQKGNSGYTAWRYNGISGEASGNTTGPDSGGGGGSPWDSALNAIKAVIDVLRNPKRILYAIAGSFILACAIWSFMKGKDISQAPKGLKTAAKHAVKQVGKAVDHVTPS